jgi:HEAT repeat protein
MTCNEHMQQWLKRCREDARSNEELLATVQACRNDSDDPRYWDSVAVLHGRFDEILWEQVRPWTDSPDATLRATAADVLGQVHHSCPPLQAPVARLLIAKAESEPEPNVLSSLAAALGHNGSPERLSALVNLADHPDANVRHAVASSLGGIDAPAAVAALLKLSEDPDVDVRDWATFGLGSMTEFDTPQLRQALLARTEDSDEETRGESIVGLARRRDVRVVAVIERELCRPDAANLVVDAAHEFPQPSFLAGLKRLDRERWDRERWDLESVAAAIAACGGDLEARPLNR